MYEVKNEILESIEKNFKLELSNRDYDYEDFAINEIFDTWLQKKQMLLKLLSKHPYWNEERLMIQFDEDFSRKINSDVSWNFVNWLQRSTNMDTYNIYEEDCFGFRMCKFSLCNCIVNGLCYSTYITEREMDYIAQINELHEDFRFREGMKATKVMRKICSVLGWDKIMGEEYNRNDELVQVNLFEREYAKYCDAMSPIKVTRHTCISLNPIDYLLMSNGNSWTSCHDIRDCDDAGEYSSGTISYMLDEHSMIFYTVDSSFNGKVIEREPKLQRQVFGYNDYQLLQSRLYPQSMDCGAEAIYTDIRNIMQKVIADCLEMPNLWTKGKVKNVYAGNGATCYQDWNCFGSLCSVSTIKGKEDEPHNPIYLGTYPICIRCGNTHYCEGNINCCEGDDYYTCEDCGCRIHEDDVYWVGDSHYCRDCVTYCEECGEYEANNYATWIPSEDIYVCERCRDRYFVYCEDCNEYTREERSVVVENGNRVVCQRCFNDNYEECSDCGNYCHRYDMTEITDKETGELHWYCSDCAEEHEEDEEDEVNEEAC